MQYMQIINQKEKDAVNRINRLFVLLFVLALAFWVGLGLALAQDAVAPSPSPLPVDPSFITAFLTAAAGKYGWVVSVLTVIGFLRLICKPLVTLIEAIVAATPTTKDDDYLRKVETSKVWQWVLWVVDWLGSIKKPGAVTNPLVK